MKYFSKELCVAILSYNGKQYLKSCLDSLLSQSLQNFDIYLVDNNSSDGSVEFVHKNYPSIHILQTNENGGYSGGYNYMLNYFKIHKIQYEYLLLLNNDTVCDISLCENACKFFKEHENVGLVCPTILNSDQTIFSEGGKFLPLSGTPISVGSGIFRPENIFVECFWGSGCAFFVRHSLFETLGGFADYFMYFEDIDLSWRVRNLGLKVLYLRNTYIVHMLGGSKAPSSLEIYYAERNRIISYWRNLDNIIFIFLFPILVLFRIILLLYYIHTFSDFKFKIKGLLDGVKSLPEFKKINSPILLQFRTLLTMSKIEEHKIV